MLSMSLRRVGTSQVGGEILQAAELLPFGNRQLYQRFATPVFCEDMGAGGMINIYLSIRSGVQPGERSDKH